MNKYLAFDIETAKITPQDDDVQDHRPLGIACWAAAWVSEKSGQIVAQSYYGRDDKLNIAPQMTVSQCIELVERLQRATEQGFTILAHNGAGFDFDILAEESGMHKECAELARGSVDTCLLMHCIKGFPVGLDAISKGFNLSGKTEGMNGSMAPQMWADGRFDEVLAYVEQDVKATLEVALEIEKQQRITWVSKTGRLNNVRVSRLLTVQESLQLPLPDTRWMTEPIPRDRFVGWMGV